MRGLVGCGGVLSVQRGFSWALRRAKRAESGDDGGRWVMVEAADWC